MTSTSTPHQVATLDMALVAAIAADLRGVPVEDLTFEDRLSPTGEFRIAANTLYRMRGGSDTPRHASVAYAVLEELRRR